MPSEKVLAMRAADERRRAWARAEFPDDRELCARADCGMPGGIVHVNGATKTVHRIARSNLRREGESYVHADPAICEAIASRRENARKRAAVNALPTSGPDDVRGVPASPSAPANESPSLP